MKVVILCGGQGTRIRDANELLPKPLLPIGDKPIVWHIMKGYAAHGIKEFILCLGYKGWLIKEFFLNYRAMTSDVTVQLGPKGSIAFSNSNGKEDWRITLAETGEFAGTGGRLVAVRRYLEGENEFCLTYGDGVSNVDIGKLIEFHREYGKIATVTAVRPPGRFGEMQMAGSLVQHFNEKPQATAGFINGGFFVFNSIAFWPYLGRDADTVLEREPLQRLAADGQLVAYEHTDFWQPMDTVREYALLNQLWASGRAPWKTW